MVDRLGQIYGVPVIETKVGFKHIAPLIKNHNALVAGEESGGFTIDGHMPDRDGILCGLVMLDMMVKTGKSVRELIDWLFSIVGSHYYKRLDVKFMASDREKILQKIDEIAAKEYHWAFGWGAPYGYRCLNWDKFGMPEHGIGYSGNWLTPITHWWIDPQKKQRLIEARKKSNVTIDIENETILATNSKINEEMAKVLKP